MRAALSGVAVAAGALLAWAATSLIAESLGAGPLESAGVADALVAASLLAAARLGAPPLVALGFPHVGSAPRPGRAEAALLLAAVATSVVAGTSIAVCAAGLGIRPPISPVDSSPIGVVLITSLVLAPLAEELVARGVLLEALSAREPAAVAVSSAIFCAMHGDPVRAASVAPLAVLLGCVSLPLGLFACVGAHCAYNAIALAIGVLAPPAVLFGWPAAVSSIAALACLIVEIRRRAASGRSA